MSSYQPNGPVSELWIQWFSCCINQPTTHHRRKRHTQRNGIRLDKSIIGNPTNFQHTGHIGSNDVELGNSTMRAIQNQMQSKGGYETSYTVLRAY